MPTPSVPQGVIDFLTHPVIGGLHPHLDHLGPFLGEVTLTQWLDAAPPSGTMQYVSATYGVVTKVTVIPPNWSVNKGWNSSDGLYDESVFAPPLVQVVAQHQFPGSFWITTQISAVDRLYQLVLWAESFPGRIGLLVQPGVEVDLFYLTVVP